MEEVSASGGFEQCVLQSIVSKKIKLEKKLEFRKQRTKVVHTTITPAMEEVTSLIEKGEDLTRANEAL